MRTRRKTLQHRIASILVKLGFFCFAAGVVTAPMVGAREKSKKMLGLHNLKRLSTAVHAYADANNGYLPPLENIAVARVALKPYVGFNNYGDAWEIPGVPEGYFQPNVSLSRKKLSSISKPGEIVLFYEPCDRAWKEHNWVRIAYADGHVKSIRSIQWPKLAIGSGIPLDSERVVRQPWDLHLGEALVIFSLELLVTSGIFGVAALITRKR